MRDSSLLVERRVPPSPLPPANGSTTYSFTLKANITSKRTCQHTWPNLRKLTNSLRRAENEKHRFFWRLNSSGDLTWQCNALYLIRLAGVSLQFTFRQRMGLAQVEKGEPVPHRRLLGLRRKRPPAASTQKQIILDTCCLSSRKNKWTHASNNNTIVTNYYYIRQEDYVLVSVGLLHRIYPIDFHEILHNMSSGKTLKIQGGSGSGDGFFYIAKHILIWFPHWTNHGFWGKKSGIIRN